MKDYTAALHDANVQAFLRVIRAGESSQEQSAYTVMFGGSHFDGFAAHPNITHVSGTLRSTAAGAYQFLFSSWGECQRALALPDFSPHSQDLAAVYLIDRRKALEDVLAGRIEEAIRKCNREWASLPGSPYGQPTRTMADALATYHQYGGLASVPHSPSLGDTPGTYPGDLPRGPNPGDRGEATPSISPDKEKPMAPLIAALLPALGDLVPKLGALFAKTPVAERNIKAATVAFDAIKQATGATNEQDAIQRMQADPAVAAVAAKAVEESWWQITEGGGGGIDGARKADAAVSGGDIRKSPSFWIAILLLPLVYMLVASLIGLIGTATWSDDVRAGLAGSLISAVIGGLVGYYYGQTTTRNRTTKE